jgi:hypothetical protein
MFSGRRIVLVFLLCLALLSFIPLSYISQVSRPQIKKEENLLTNDFKKYANSGLPTKILRELPYISQIEKDLKPFASGITLDMVKKAYEIGCAVRLQYINKTLYSYLILEVDRAPYGDGMCNGRANSFMTLIKRVVDRFPLVPDFDIVVNSLDNCRICNLDGNTMAYEYFGDSGMFWPPVWGHIPIFSFQKLDGCLDILVPAAIVGLGMGDYDNDIKHISEVSNTYPWSMKQDKLIWRGSGTGGLWNNENLDSKPRYRIFLECEKDKLKEICDIGLSGLFQTLPNVEIRNEKILLKGNIPFDDWMNYKYELILDGNGSPAGRIDRQLAHNSLILMQETSAHQMYTKYLKPHKHYIPIKSNVSDLSDAYEWAAKNEEIVLQIIKNANQFTEYIKTDPVLAYTGALLLKYAELQKFKPQLETGHHLVA